jgi:plastocyanin
MSSRLLLLVCASLALAVACSKPAPTPAPAGGGKHVDPETAGAITGKVVLQGTPPPNEPLRMGVDPNCVQNGGSNPVSDAVLVAPDGAVQNAFVYVKDGLDSAYSFDVPTEPVTLDQKGCRYSPRILGVRAGQPLMLVNSDPTMHNVHALPMTNQEFNASAPVQGWRSTKTFTAAEVSPPVRFKCDVHGWMIAYVGVMAHPFFAVTKPDGTFELKGVPPGTYTIGAWHEKFGTQTTQVTVGPKQSQSVSFTYKVDTGK